MKGSKRVWAFILAAAMLCGVLPATAFAERPAFDSGNYVKFEAIESGDLNALKTLLQEKTEGEMTLGEALWPEGLYQRMMDSGILYKQKADGIPAFNFDKKNPSEQDPGKLVEIDLTYVKGMNLDKLDYFKEQLEFLSVAEGGRTGELDLSEFTSLRKLLSFNNELTEIKLGSELELIECGNNKLKKLDFLSGQEILKELYCHGNELTALDLEDLTALELIECGDNQLKTLDFLGGQENLKSLYCYENELTTLDLRGLTALELINCGDNKLKTLVLNPKNSLKRLYCYGNELTALDLKNLTALEELNLSKNKLTGTLDISGLTDLTGFDAWENPLTTIKVKNGTAVSTITAVGRHILVGANMYDGVYRLGADVPEADRESFDIGSFMNNGKEMELEDWDTEGYENPEDENDNGWGRLKPDVAYNITVSALPKAVTKEMLSAKASEAAAYLAGIVPSEDGKNVPADKKWAAEQVCARMRGAIEYAQEVFNDEESDGEAYRNAYNHLLSEMGIFEAALKDGTAGVDKALLNKAITDAEAAKKDIVISEKAAGEVAKGTRFVKAAEMAALDAAIKTAEEAAPITTEQANAAADKLNAAAAAFKAAIKTGAYTSGGGSSSSGGGSSYTTPTPKAIGSAAASSAAAAVKDALAKGIASTRITFSNYQLLTLEGIKAINDAADKAVAGTKVKLNLLVNFDVVEEKAVQSRITMDAAKLAAVAVQDVKLGVQFKQQSDQAVQDVNSTFEQFFDNKVRSVVYDQLSPMAVTAEFAAKLDLTGLNTQTLCFYSYDNANNTHSRITNPQYWVDTKGYTHITAPFGGSIIITDKPLKAK